MGRIQWNRCRFISRLCIRIRHRAGADSGGALMISAVAEIEWTDPMVAVPAFLTLITIPLTFSIANGLAFGITSFALLRLLRGRARRQDWMLYVLAALFLLRFLYMAKSY